MFSARTSPTERRGLPRHQAPAEAVAIVQSGLSAVARIKDISLGGLRLERFGRWEEASGELSVDIMVKPVGFFLAEMRCEMVWRQGSASGSKAPLRGERQTCGVRFLDAPGQQAKIELLGEFLRSGALESLDPEACRLAI
ncbi:type IV pilus assembly PilZ [Desulfarculus baarsii DSM 2075]|uniref:Type IV pilus assembly PilZ n=1 Tax=Desulfarculus baarsii (strain ATCC 33931 / DSM 2075 / LMG 7858 / VKM B-1802 / 2st14) TaxID=644282 RepID=E1QKE8_DESB2|nr:type IV pilus assembly PilZ [Desulfarculus baarsii DSM 2075]